MTSPDPALVDQLSSRADLGRARELVPLAGGSNNRVFRADCERGPAVLKCYFRSPADPRDRLGAEFAFSRYARAAGVVSVPEPLASDPPSGLGLFEFVEGSHPECATDSLISEAAGFVRAINSPHAINGRGIARLGGVFQPGGAPGRRRGRANRLGTSLPNRRSREALSSSITS